MTDINNEEHLLGIVDLNVVDDGFMEEALEKMRQEAMSLWVTPDMEGRLGEFPTVEQTQQNAMPIAIAIHELVSNMKADGPDLEGVATLLLLAHELKIMAAVHFVRQVAGGYGPPLPFGETPTPNPEGN